MFGQRGRRVERRRGLSVAWEMKARTLLPQFFSACGEDVLGSVQGERCSRTVLVSERARDGRGERGRLEEKKRERGRSAQDGDRGEGASEQRCGAVEAVQGLVLTASGVQKEVQGQQEAGSGSGLDMRKDEA